MVCCRRRSNRGAIPCTSSACCRPRGSSDPRRSCRSPAPRRCRCGRSASTKRSCRCNWIRPPGRHRRRGRRHRTAAAGCGEEGDGQRARRAGPNRLLHRVLSFASRRLDARRTCVGYGSSRGPTSPIWVGTDSHLLLRGVTSPLDRGGAYRNRALRRTARRKPRPRVVANRGAAMNTRNVLTGFVLVVSLVGQGAIALSRAGESSVRVLARGPAGLRIEGKSSQIDFEEDASALTFKVPIAPIETGIGLRDRHLRETLEADKFPAAILRVSRSELTFPNEHDAAEGTAQGDLTLHGRSRPVQVRYRAERGAAGVTRVHGSVQLDMHDFEIKSPSYLGVSVTPQVEVTVEMAVEGA